MLTQPASRSRLELGHFFHRETLEDSEALDETLERSTEAFAFVEPSAMIKGLIPVS
jgi:hypothetical protein